MFGAPQRAGDTNCCFHEHQEWVGAVAPANRPFITFTASRETEVQLCRLNLERIVCMIKVIDFKLVQATQRTPNYNIMQFIIVCFSPQLGRPSPSWSQSPQWRLYWSYRCASVFGNVSCAKKVSLAIFPPWFHVRLNRDSRRKTKLHNHMLLCRDRYDALPFLTCFHKSCKIKLFKKSHYFENPGFVGCCQHLIYITIFFLAPLMINSSWNISS